MARQQQVTETIVSPDALTGNIEPSVTTGRKTVILVPMEEWKQSAQRGVRTTLQAGTFFIGGGTLVGALSSAGVSPKIVEGIPSTGNPLWDAILYAILFGVLVFLWNFIEFWLDIDLKAPKWRA